MTARDDDKTFCIFSPDNLPLKCKICQRIPQRILGKSYWTDPSGTDI